jgi:4-hydroxy-3-polyprenylbenzoate decarboxylase
MNIILAITGASGAIYARQSLELLLGARDVERIALILSENAEGVIAHEGITLSNDSRIERFANNDMWSSVASGSAQWDAMIVVPASMGTVGRIASGVSQSLIERAADVMLKERRRLIVVVRETPYSLIHLRNMTTLTEAGAIVLPASPSFYSHPATIDEAVDTVVERIIAHTGIDLAHYEFSGVGGK